MTGLLPTSPLQRGIWFNEQLADLGSAYTVAVTACLRGRVDVERLAQAYAVLAACHPLLTAAVVNLDGLPWLAIGAHQPVLEVEATDEETIRDRVDQVARTRFDLSTGPLVRAWLFTLGDGRSVLAVAAHHLIVDGQSKEILLRDLADLYHHREPIRRTAPADRTPPGSLVAAAAEYWWRHPPRPTDLHRSSGPQAGDTVVRALPRQARIRLAEAAVELAATRFELLLTALVGCLAPEHGPTSIAIELSVRSPAEAGLIGMYVNELPLTLTAPPAGSFEALSAGSFTTPSAASFAVPSDGSFTAPPAGSFAATLAAVRAGLRKLYDYRTVPLAMCCPGLRPFLATASISVSYRRIAPAPVFAGLTATVDWSAFNGVARNDLHVMIADGDQTHVTLQFPSAAGARRRAEAMIDRVLAVLDHGLTAPHAPFVRPLEDPPPWT